MQRAHDHDVGAVTYSLLQVSDCHVTQLSHLTCQAGVI